MIQLFNTLAQATPQARPQGLQAIIGHPMFLMVIMIVLFYFLLIRPQQRNRKEQATRIAALKTGDKVVTTAGLHGIVHNVKDTTVVIKVAEGTNLEFDKAAVASVVNKLAKKD
jgi:preprotein translocase subunit YajC